MDSYSTPRLPTDMMYKIPTSISDPASLARLASSCKLWRGFIKDRAFLDRLRRRHRDHGFTPSLLLGFFFQDNTESAPRLWQHEMDKNLCLAPSFTPTSELSQFIGGSSEGAGHRAGDPLSLGTFIQGLGASLNFYDPVASRDSFLVLRRRSEDSTSDQATADPDELRVCNPLTGENFDIPPLRTVSPDLHYALFDVADDVGPDGRLSQSFQLVAILIKKKKFMYSCYSSKTGTWRRSLRVPELMDGLYLVSPLAAVSHGAVHWLCGSWKHWRLTHVVTLHVDAQELSYLELPPEAKHNKVPPLLATSADGGSLLLLYVQGLEMSLWKHDSDDQLGISSSWVLSETIDMKSALPLRVVKMGIKAKIRLEMFQGKSGMVLLWVDGEGLFLFSLCDGSMKKIDSENITKKHCMCPYEIDWLSCLAITNLVVDGSLSLDEGRKKARDRWRTLMAWRPTKHAA